MNSIFLSNYLVDLTKNIAGSTMFIIETETGFVIASDSGNNLDTWNSDGTITRMVCCNMLSRFLKPIE